MQPTRNTLSGNGKDQSSGGSKADLPESPEACEVACRSLPALSVGQTNKADADLLFQVAADYEQLAVDMRAIAAAGVASGRGWSRLRRGRRCVRSGRRRGGGCWDCRHPRRRQGHGRRRRIGRKRGQEGGRQRVGGERPHEGGDGKRAGTAGWRGAALAKALIRLHTRETDVTDSISGACRLLAMIAGAR